jgi:hypothetical protein
MLELAGDASSWGFTASRAETPGGFCSFPDVGEIMKLSDTRPD